MSIPDYKLHVESLKDRFKTYQTISVNDFNEFYKEVFGDIKRSTVSWYIYELKKKKVIRHISRGQYALFDKYTDTSEKYIVITMDIIKSTELNYNSFNKELLKKVNMINNILRDSFGIDRKYHISQGDEIQIILAFGEHTWDVLLLTLSVLYPYETRYGISVGDIQGELKQNSWEMNSPLFWNARDQLEKLKNKHSYDGLIKTGFSRTDRLCNNILPLINKALSRMTDKQWEAVMENLQKLDLDSILKDLKISKTSYYERLDVSNIKEISQSFEAIQDLIKMREEIN